jgi:NADPH-dependent curcumin reductase CurA
MQGKTSSQWILKTRPEGRFKLSDFEKRQMPVSELKENEVLLKTLYLSFDPTQRGWAAMDTYMPAVKLGEVMRAIGLGQVIESKNKKYKVGDIVAGLLGWQEYVLIAADAKEGDFAVLPPFLKLDLTLSFMITGLTAYFGLFDIGKPKRGETVVVSGAAGATGSIVGQLAKLAGARVIGIAGGAKKCAWLTEKLGFDGAIDYQNENVQKRVAELCPKGVDVFFDNVGGEIMDAVLLNLALNSRIVLCGQISQYEKIDSADTAGMGKVYGVKSLAMLTIARATMKGFIILDYQRRNPEGLVLLNKWVDEGKLIAAIDMQEGFDNIPQTLIRLFEGKNMGKQLLKLSDPVLPLKSGRIGKAMFKLLGSFYSWKTGIGR